MDVWGPASCVSAEGYQYCFLIVDDYTRYSWVFPLKLKSEVLGLFKQFFVYVERQFCVQVKFVQSDINMHPQNGLVEQKIQHVTELGLAVLMKCGVSMNH